MIERRSRKDNPAMRGFYAKLIIFACFLPMFIVMLFNMARMDDENVGILLLEIFTIVVVAMAIMIGSVVIFYRSRELGRLATVKRMHPEDLVLQGSWTTALLQPFIKCESWPHGMNVKHFSFTLDVSSSGISWWWGKRNHPVNLGELPWVDIEIIERVTTQAAIGTRMMPTLRIKLRTPAHPLFHQEIRLFICTDTGTDIRDQNLVDERVGEILKARATTD